MKKKTSALKQEPVPAVVTAAPVAAATTEDDDDDTDLLSLGKKLGQIWIMKYILTLWTEIKLEFSFVIDPVVNYIGGGEEALTDEAAEDDDTEEEVEEEETEEVEDAATAGEAILGLVDDDEEEAAEAGAKDPAEAEESEEDADSDDFALLGVGDDLFEAFFSDDTPAKKKTKPTVETPVVATVAATPAATVVETVAAVEEAKPTVTKAKPAKKSSIKKAAVKKPVAVASVEKVSEVSAEKPQSPFQHTPALLELAQGLKKDEIKNEINGENDINSGSSINQITDQLLDSTDKFDADDSEEGTKSMWNL